ncbi:MAG: DNA translocase FtsK 4TM domain-containing protein [Alphaproteobacteria bacterium]|nr:DNA translocase FtsK 4TM domain-containing protein [Alphaproteobacteria bacterium]
MAKKKVKKEEPKAWWKVFLSKIIGAAFVVLPLLIFVGLIDYHAADPSFNKVSSQETDIQNCLGAFGAYSADAVLRTFGLSLIIFLFIPILWGIELWRDHGFAECKMRIFAWFVGMLSLACFIDLTASTYLGAFNLPYNLAGEWSRVLSRPLNSYINMLNFPYNTILFEGIILFVSLISFNYAAGVTFKFWLNIGAFISGIFAKIGNVFVNVFKKAANIKNFREFRELNPSYLQNKTQGGLQKTRIRREPNFEQADDVVSGQVAAPQYMVQTGSLHAAMAQSAVEPMTSRRSLTIEMPNSNTAAVGNLAIQTEPETDAVAVTKNSSFNPTFDFINDENLANQNQKKQARKISPEEIYQMEGVKAFSSKAAKTKASSVREAYQEELLNIPKTAAKNLNTAPQSQAVSGAAFENTAAAVVEIPQSAVAPKEKVKSDEYMLPDVNLLSLPKETAQITIDEDVLKENAAKLEQVLKDFGIKGQIVKVRPGPVVTLYELEPAPGTRTARVIGLSDDIARSMSAMSVRMAVVSGHNTIGIELPNVNRQTVWLRELLEDVEFKNSKNILNVALGKDIGGQHVYADLSKMPHLLVAGTTGSGKSVGVNSMILSLLYRMTPEQCKFIMIDPKQLEFSMYNGIPHLLTPVITDPAKAVVGLKWAVQEMESRYRSMALLNVRNIAGYNKKVAEMNKSGKEIKKTIQTGFDRETGKPIYEEQTLDTSPMPYIVIVVDEMADLMLVAGKEVEAAIQRLAQMARAAGIHLIMSTQRPSVDVITGVIKANFPSRISFHVTTRGDSITILGEKGAEQLLGMGDMLYMPSGLRPIRIHGCFVPDEEVEKIVEFIKEQEEPQYVTEVTAGELNTKDSGPVFDKGEFGAGDAEEDLYMQAVEIVKTEKKASTSYIQRKLRIGYNRAANLIERMEREGIVSKPDHVNRREVIGVD